MKENFPDIITTDPNMKLKAMEALVEIVKDDKEIMEKFVDKFFNLLTQEEKIRLKASLTDKDLQKNRPNKFCSNCGAENKDGNYCTSCGKPLKS